MVRPMYRSRSLARLKRRLPGNNTTVHYEKRKPSAAHCPITGEVLRGVPVQRQAQLRKLPKSSRRPNRPYGGKLSATALSSAIHKAVLNEIEMSQQTEE